MIVLAAGNQRVRILGAPTKVLAGLDRICSYRVSGYRFSSAFKVGRWDGKQHLLVYRKNPSGYFFPFGLLEDVCAYLNKKALDFEVRWEERREQREEIGYEWNQDIVLRPYQNLAVREILSGGWRRGTGILKMPPRSGKTKTAARIIWALKARTLFIVSSDSSTMTLLYQAHEALKDALGVSPGIIGDQRWYEGDVTVASIQTLTRRRQNRAPDYLRLLDRYDCVIFDEAHHLKGNEWHKVMMDFDAPYKIGLSATAYLNDEGENQKGVIWLKACCGDVRVDFSPSELIEAGYLLRPQIKLYPIDKPDLSEENWDGKLLEKAIYKNSHRNQEIARIVRALVRERGLKTLVVSSRLAQVRDLTNILQGKGLRAESITGATSSGLRRRIIQKFQKGEVEVIVGTVFGEGVDIPEIEAVVNAEGGKDPKAVIQRLRNLTLSEGKTEAVMVDFIDRTNPYVADHSLARLRAYRAEPAFNIELSE
jgi:superfamily II DNA or RNA helicase